MVEALMIPPDALWSTLVMYTQPYPSDLLQHVRPYHEVSILLQTSPTRVPSMEAECIYGYMMTFENYNQT